VTVRGALLSDFAHQARAVLRLRGPDTSRFVQGTITADVVGARPGFAIAGALLTVKGKLVTDLVVLPLGEGTLDLLVPAAWPTRSRRCSSATSSWIRSRSSDAATCWSA
jgi:glycine cleavage system aminomethyltransferase T